ncbi:MAG: type II secretion system protein GspF [Armatimonadetes bacterium]|nr:type II secretion system protein GspF [Armatimonadota bacterium]
MPTFSYVAVDDAGREVVGEIHAEDLAAAIGRVRESGNYPMEVREAAPARAAGRPGGLFGRTTAADRTILTRQLSNLLGAGLTVVRALSVLIDNTDNPRVRDILLRVREEVQTGSALSDTLAKFPRLFDTLYVNLVRAGEASGDLEGVLERLADYQEQQAQQSAAIRSALAYPTLLISVGTAAVLFLVTFLIPRFVVIFESLGQALPLPTRVILGISTFLAHYWWGVLGGLIVLVLILRWYVRTPSGSLAFDSVKIKPPIIGPLSFKIAASRFAHTLGTLLRGGVPILEALETVQGAIGNRMMSHALDEVRDSVREGEPIADPLRRTRAFPSLVVNMIAVGEETGEVDTILQRVAHSYDMEIQNTVRQLISLLEPVIILAMGLIVGSVIISMLLPIFDLNLMASK